MNYQKIYKSFIDDRLAKQDNLSGYFEKHHILPRALGGSDDASNIINLLPEDHFFSHLLLAKIYGGKMWAPIAFMVGGNRKNWKPCKSRREYGWAIREMAKNVSGENSYQFDRTIYELEHQNYKTWRGVQSEFSDIGISKSLGNMLIKGRVKTAKGWYLKGKRPDTFTLADYIRKSHPMKRDDVFEFVHKDGSEFSGTLMDFWTKFKISKPCACRLVNGKQIQASGWKIKGSTLKRKPDPARIFTLEDGNRKIVGTAREIANIMGKTDKAVQVATSKLVKGEIKSYNGYVLVNYCGGKNFE